MYREYGVIQYKQLTPPPRPNPSPALYPIYNNNELMHIHTRTHCIYLHTFAKILLPNPVVYFSHLPKSLNVEIKVAIHWSFPNQQQKMSIQKERLIHINFNDQSLTETQRSYYIWL